MRSLLEKLGAGGGGESRRDRWLAGMKLWFVFVGVELVFDWCVWGGRTRMLQWM